MSSPEDEGVPWQRLHPLMLVVSPVQELVRFFPLVIAAIIWSASSTDDGGWPWQWLGVGLPIAMGLWTYLTTRWRITPTQIQLRRGLIGHTTKVAPLDRVRGVELTATLIHWMLGLSRVRIDTGESAALGREAGFQLDSMQTAQAQELRRLLLHRSEPDYPGGIDPDEPEQSGSTRAETLLSFTPTWARFAPLTTSGVVLLGAGLALAGQILGPGLEQVDESALEHLQIATWLLVAIGLVGLVSILVVFPMAGYLVANWGFRLTKDAQDNSYHVRRGLFTTQETSLDCDRIRGVELHQTLPARFASAGSLNALVAGLPAGESTDQGASPLTPLAPLAACTSVAGQVLRSAGPMEMELIAHGPLAARRRWNRVALTFLPLVGLMVGMILWFELWLALLAIPGLMLVAGAFLAVDRYRQLGHGHLDGYLVVASGSLLHQRSALATDAIIGWNFRQSFFQRRQGLITLDATVATSDGCVTALDLSQEASVSLASQVTPELLGPFLK